MVYNQQWFNRFQTEKSSLIVAKIVYDILKPESAVDIGCGLGAWLKTFQSLGVKEIQGVDGDYIDTQWLEIPADRFKAHDLRQPLQLDETYDLAICLEVGEHLPTESSETLVKSLVDAASVVMFSAAVPFQGGTAHINEQWPSFWASLFMKYDYVPVDCVRNQIWEDRDVHYFYRQNIVLYVNKAKLSDNPYLEEEAKRITDVTQLNLVHPDMLTYMHMWRGWSLFRQAIRNAIDRRRRTHSLDGH